MLQQRMQVIRRRNGGRTRVVRKRTGTHEVRGIDSHVFCEGLFLVLHNDERNVFGKPRRF